MRSQSSVTLGNPKRKERKKKKKGADCQDDDLDFSRHIIVIVSCKGHRGVYSCPDKSHADPKGKQ